MRFMWRKNHSGQDLYKAFLDAWGRTEADIRSGIVTVEELYGALNVDWSAYEDREKVLRGDVLQVEAEQSIPWQYSKLWFCWPECGYMCYGKQCLSLR